jgi:hypothetical protein
VNFGFARRNAQAMIIVDVGTIKPGRAGGIVANWTW